MTTKSPSSVASFAPETLEKIAYDAVADVPVREFNDRNRIGYCVWAWLKDRKGTLEHAIRAAGARTQLADAEVVAVVRKNLAARGIDIA